MRTGLFGVGVLLVVVGGCAPSAEHHGREVQLQQVAHERDALKEELRKAEAENGVLRQRVSARATDGRASQAEVSALAAEVDRLTERNDQLRQVIEQQTARRLTRPSVPSAVRLPEDVAGALQALSAKYSGRMTYDSLKGAVSFANDRLFGAGDDVVRADAHAALHELAAVLKMVPNGEFEIMVVGHTDDMPITKPETLARHPSNFHLSVHRAIAVKDVLVKGGFPAARIGVAGYGKHRPVSGDRAQNRRVEVFIVRQGGLRPLS